MAGPYYFIAKIVDIIKFKYYYCDYKNVIKRAGVMPPVYDVQVYKTASGREPVNEYLKDLQQKHKLTEAAQIQAYIKRLKVLGMDINATFPHTIRKVTSDIWELRPGGNRVFFFHFTGKTFVLLHAYRKSSQKAPSSEIEKAEKEMKDYCRRSKK